jgi:hypothetical protein
MPDTDIFDLLVALRDVGASSPPDGRLDERCRAALQREIDREQRRGRGRRSYHRRGVMVALSMAALSLVGGVGYAALSSPNQMSAGIDCHADAALSGSGTITAVDGRAATQACAQLWAQGAVSDGSHAPPAPLHACVDPNGGNAIHVFPSAQSDVCARVGLREDPTAGADPSAQRYATFSNKLARWLGATRCPTASAARTEIHDDLASAGLGGWEITSGGVYDPQQPCASVALNSDTRTATIIPTAQ